MVVLCLDFSVVFIGSDKGAQGKKMLTSTRERICEITPVFNSQLRKGAIKRVCTMSTERLIQAAREPSQMDYKQEELVLVIHRHQ